MTWGTAWMPNGEGSDAVIEYYLFINYAPVAAEQTDSWFLEYALSTYDKTKGTELVRVGPSDDYDRAAGLFFWRWEYQNIDTHIDDININELPEDGWTST